MPQATPLIGPQSVWYAGLAIFALLASGRINVLDRDFDPKSAMEELKEEFEGRTVEEGEKS